MTTASVPISTGAGLYVASYSISEDTVTKQLQRVVLNDSFGTELTSLSVILTAETTKVIGTVNQGTSPWVISGAVQPGSALTGPGNPTIDSYQHLAINLAAGANQVLVSSAANKQIWVYGVGFVVNVAGTVSFQDEDDTVISGIMPFAANSGMAIPVSGNFAMPIWKLATNKDLECDVVTSEIDGWLCYSIVSV